MGATVNDDVTEPAGCGQPFMSQEHGGYDCRRQKKHGMGDNRESKTCIIANSDVPIADGAAGTAMAKNVVPMITSVAVIGEMSRLTARVIIQAEMPSRSQ